MGLDMYLYKKTYVENWKHMTEEELHQITVLRNHKPTFIKPERIVYITEKIGYWRKANAIHDWFVENVQGGEDDCGEYTFEYDKLLELKTLCQRVLENHDLAPELLPTREGFFFGSTEYDEYYFSDLEDTIKIIDELEPEVMETSNGEKFIMADLVYHSSW